MDQHSDPCNIAAHLPAMAAARPDTMAVAVQAQSGEPLHYSYRELDQVSDALARGLQEMGIGRGTRTVLMVKPGLEFFGLVFALFKVGAVMVAIDPGMGMRNLGDCLREAEPEAFIGNRLAHMARVLYGWGRETLKIKVVSEPWPLLGLLMASTEGLRKRGAGSDRPAMNPVQGPDPAAILFTSGSTGVPKGVNYTHANFTAQLQALRTLYDIRPGEIDLATFPLFALYAPALGMTAIVPDMDFTRPGSVDPVRIVQAITDFDATSMFGSPALLDRVSRWGVDRGIQLPTLKRVISAGAPVSPAIIRRVTQLLGKDVEVFTPFGATEALPVASIGSREVLGETGRGSAQGRGVCVGRPVAGTRVAVIAISDEAIADWESVSLMDTSQVGEIVVQGPQVTASYCNRPHADALAKIRDGNHGFYHRMGDLGYLDAKGRLWYCGRKSERVETDGKVLFTVCCEGVFNAHARVRRSALVGLRRADGKEPALCVELETDSQHTDRTVLTRELLDLGAACGHTAGIKRIFYHPGFPVDIRHNAKIDRAALAAWVQGQA